jgi:hypothetical protein
MVKILDISVFSDVLSEADHSHMGHLHRQSLLDRRVIRRQKDLVVAQEDLRGDGIYIAHNITMTIAGGLRTGRCTGERYRIPESPDSETWDTVAKPLRLTLADLNFCIGKVRQKQNVAAAKRRLNLNNLIQIH